VLCFVFFCVCFNKFFNIELVITLSLKDRKTIDSDCIANYKAKILSVAFIPIPGGRSRGEICQGCKSNPSPILVAVNTLLKLHFSIFHFPYFESTPLTNFFLYFFLFAIFSLHQVGLHCKQDGDTKCHVNAVHKNKPM